MRSRGTHAWTTAEIAKPNTSAHQTSHAIRKASLSPIQIVSNIDCHRSTCPPGVSVLRSRSMSEDKPLRGYSATKDQLIKRLRRVQGQVGGIERMVADERYCIDVVTQITAVQAA